MHDTINERRTEWNEAIAAIRSSDGVTASTLYEHFELTPQLGLVPIGMDQESHLWEFLHVLSGTPGTATPKRDKQTGRVIPDGAMGIVFVLLPGGGLPLEDGAKPDHRHSVRLDQFFLSKYEMTQGQWLRLTGDNPSWGTGSDSSLATPVEAVSWVDCDALMRRQGFVLPSELQWEYACRAGTTSVWWTGATEQSMTKKENWGPHRVVAVGSLAPNPFGLFDIAGNVREWCLDDDEEYGTERNGDGARPCTLEQYCRVCRGGGRKSFATDLASDDGSSGKRCRSLSQGFRTGELGVRPAKRVAR